MYCKSCGSQIDDDSKYCTSCGADLTTVDYKKPQPEPQPAAQTQPASYVPQPQQIPYNSQTQPAQKSNTATTVILVILGVLLVLCVCCGLTTCGLIGSLAGA